MPLGMVGVLGLMVIPLPTPLLDLLLAFSVTVAVVLLLTSMQIRRPLELSSFPSLLLMTTLLRLALNVSTTRLILLHGDQGTDAAGSIIQTFGDFVVGGSYAVGIVVFLILTLINFIVITKGSGRIAEVSARFTLDALPGKQMSIDSDLAAGLIDQEQARARRREVARETDFYGAMDGASKFVRGDAIAGLVITGINILGGLIIGVAQHGLSVSEAAQTYTVLTIGDGLVSQIPTLLVSTAAGIVVTRSGDESDLGRVLGQQLLTNRKVLAGTLAVLGALMLIPGMPLLAFLALMGGIYALYRRATRADAAAAAPAGSAAPAGPGGPSPAAPPPETEEDRLMEALEVRPIELEVGYGLIPLVDPTGGGALIERMAGLRQKIARELGLVIPPIHVRDSLELAPGGYRLNIHGVTMVDGEVMPDRHLAMDPGDVREVVDGIPTVEPAFGLDALWIPAATRPRAELAGYTVVPPEAVIITHVGEILAREAHQLLGREELQDLLDLQAKRTPRIVEELIPTQLTHAELLAVLRGLLREQVSIRDLGTILETLAEAVRYGKATYYLTEQARQRLGPAIVQSNLGADGKLHAAIFDAAAEETLRGVLVRQEGDAALAPGLRLAQALLGELQQAQRELHDHGYAAVVVAPSDLRYPLWRFASRFLPDLRFVGQGELPPTAELVTHRTMTLPRNGTRGGAG